MNWVTYLNHALDIGCGSGQSTALLSPYFKQVTGIDVSKAQIEEAIKNNKLPNIEYKVSFAEEIKLQSQSIELITASQSVHWFDLPKFYKEVDRLLIPNGVLAMYGYSVMMPYPSNVDARIKASDVVNKFYEEDMGSYWPSERCHIDNCYENIIFPYDDHIRTTVVNQTETSLLNYFGYFTTWSSYQKLLKEDPKKAKFLMNRFQNSFTETLLKLSKYLPPIYH